MIKNVAYSLHINHIVYGGFMKDTVPKMLDNLKNTNLNYNINIRFRRTSTNAPYLLYLDLFHNGKRHSKSLGLPIAGEKNTKIRDENNLRKALQIRQKYQTQFDKDPDNFSFTKKDLSNFIDFFEQMAKRKKDKNYRLSLLKFQEFYKDDILEINNLQSNWRYEICEPLKADYLWDHTM